MQKKEFVRGAAILASAALVVKIIGAAYRIPLTAMVGTQEMGVYTAAFHVYALFSALTTAGIPTVAAQLCAMRLAAGDEKGAQTVFAVSKRLLVTLGAAAAAALFFFSEQMAALMQCPQAAAALRAVSPSLFFGAWIAAYRARFQGMQKMGGIAVSQLAEQCVRAGAGLFFARFLLSYGAGMGAAGALLGTTASEIAGIAVIKALHGRSAAGAYDAQTAQKMLHRAFALTLGACVTPVCSMLDSMMLVPRLALYGQSAAQALDDYGVLTAMTGSVSSLPLMLTGALSASLVPNIAASAGNALQRRRRAQQGVGLAVLFSAAAGCGLFLVAEPMMRLLYPSLGEEKLALAAQLLRIGALGGIAHGVSIAACGALQGLGHMRHGALCQALCALVRVPLAFVLLPRVGVAGYSYASCAGAAVSCIVSLYFLRRFCAGNIVRFQTVFCAWLGCALMTGAVVFLQRVAGYGTLSMCLSILLGAAVYLAACVPALAGEEKNSWEKSRSSALEGTRAV